MQDALDRAVAARDERQPLSIGLLGNAAELVPAAARDGRADRHRHRPDERARPAGLPADRRRLRRHEGLRGDKKPAEFTDRARESMARHVEAMVGFMDKGAEVFDYGNSIRGEAQLAGYARAFDFPGFVPAYIRPLFCEGKGPFRWAALSGDPKDIARTDAAVLDLFPENESLRRWMTLAQERVALPGPARAHLLARLRRARQGRARLQRPGRLRRGLGAAGHRPRPPRLRLGRLALPRDRVDARRLRRDRRLAAAQRDGQRRERRHLGVDPPRRRRRHRPVASTPARSPSPTARRWPRRRSSAC